MVGVMVGWLAPPKSYPVGQFLWLALLFLAVFVLGMSVLIAVDRWRKRPEEKPTSASEQMAEFESLFAQGEISQKEYESIKLSLTKKLRQELAVQQPPPGGAPAPAPPAPDPPGSTDAPS
jgi:uncharacterized membrane protein